MPADPDNPAPLAEAAAALARDGFAFARAATIQAALNDTDWHSFAQSWNDLGIDRYMADGGRYRRRRHGAFALAAPGPDGLRPILRKPHQPHYQSRDYNALNGGIERWFAPLADSFACHPTTRATITVAATLFDALTRPDQRPESWHVELHQFRIEAMASQEGRPTPEGMHRDGVDWVLVMLIARHNVASGQTTIADLQRQEIGRFTLTDPGDTALVDDSRVYHGVTAIHPTDATRPAWRDVLVVTFRRA